MKGTQKTTGSAPILGAVSGILPETLVRQDAEPCGLEARAPHKFNQSGSAIVYALVVMAISSLVLAGWVNLLASRAQNTELMSDAVAHRITLQNSRALAGEYLLENVLPGSYSGTASLSLGTAAAVTFTTAGVLEPLNSTGVSAAVNVFSPGVGGGFTVDIAANLSDGTTVAVPWLFQARSRSPMFGFDLVTSQTPTISPSSSISVSSSLHIDQNTVVWTPNSPHSYSFRTGTYQTPTVTFPTMTPPLNGPGQSVLMSNFAFVPVTSGMVGSDLGYTGKISVINGGTSGVPYTSSLLVRAGWPVDNGGDADGEVSIFTDTDSSPPDPGVDPTDSKSDYKGGVSSDGDGRITIDLDSTSYTWIYILGGDVRSITLQGDRSSTADYYSSPTDNVDSEDDLRPGLLIVYVQPAIVNRDLDQIYINGRNNRRVYLAVKKATSSAVTIRSDSSGIWRLGAVFENTPVTFQMNSGDIDIVGGLRTDSSITVSGGDVNVYRELDPTLNLEGRADRFTWLEGYRQ